MMKITKVIDDNNTIRWYNEDGQLHREDGPAVEWANGDKFWCINGQFHREDGPAIEYANGAKSWWINDQLHREDGPAIEYANGDKLWWINGEELTEEEFNKRTQPHAVAEWADGTKKWYLNGQLHREDGPALEWADGVKFWYLNGEELTEEEFNRRTQPHKEMTVAQLERELGYKIKIVKG